MPHLLHELADTAMAHCTVLRAVETVPCACYLGHAVSHVLNVIAFVEFVD